LEYLSAERFQAFRPFINPVYERTHREFTLQELLDHKVTRFAGGSGNQDPWFRHDHFSIFIICSDSTL